MTGASDLYFVDPDLTRLRWKYEVADFPLSHVKSDLTLIEFALGEQPIYRSLNVAPAIDYGTHDKFPDGIRDIEGRMIDTSSLYPMLQNVDPLLRRGLADLNNETSRKARSYPIIQDFKIIRRPVSRQDNLPAAIKSSIQRVSEFGLSRLALHELKIVENQHVNAAQRSLELHCSLTSDRIHEAVNELLSR